MAMNTREPELAAAARCMEAVQRSIELHGPDGTDLGPAYKELDAAAREHEVVVPKWRESRTGRGPRRVLVAEGSAGRRRPD